MVRHEDKENENTNSVRSTPVKYIRDLVNSDTDIACLHESMERSNDNNDNIVIILSWSFNDWWLRNDRGRVLSIDRTDILLRGYGIYAVQQSTQSPHQSFLHSQISPVQSTTTANNKNLVNREDSEWNLQGEEREGSGYCPIMFPSHPVLQSYKPYPRPQLRTRVPGLTVPGYLLYSSTTNGFLFPLFLLYRHQLRFDNPQRSEHPPRFT